MPYRTIIIEDDSMVAAIDRQYVESDRRFQVQKTFKSGGDALEFLKDQETDLIILDYYTPGHDRGWSLSTPCTAWARPPPSLW